MSLEIGESQFLHGTSAICQPLLWFEMPIAYSKYNSPSRRPRLRSRQKFVGDPFANGFSQQRINQAHRMHPHVAFVEAASVPITISEP
jgi:hypothetical protein